MADIDIPYASPLNLAKATVVITGGSSGIGLGMAEHFLRAGSTVIICGRREEELDKAKALHPALITYSIDVGDAAQRIAFANTILTNHPAVNVLFNNAGVQRRVPLVDDGATEWAVRQQEIDINIGGPVHLLSLFAAHLIAQPEAAIINTTSSLGFTPVVFCPVYSATKAFLHSFTLSARASFRNTRVQVIEIAPPAVKSNLGGSHDYGEETDEFCAAVFGRVVLGHKEIGFNQSETARLQDRAGMHRNFDAMAEANDKTGKNKYF